MDRRITELLDHLGPKRWGLDFEAEAFDTKPFASLPPGEQSLVLFMRSLVSKAPLLILDEVFAGMDSRMIAAASEYLRNQLDPKQAVVFITHWEEEVPWDARFTRKIRLEDGYAKIH